MKKILLIIALSISAIPIYAINVQSLFNLSNNGEIVYYKSGNINNEDYIQAENIKSNLEGKGYKVYSIVIADILPKNGNELIALASSSQGDIIFIYNKDNEEFSYKTDKLGNNAAVDLENFYDKKDEVGIIKYYIINDKYYNIFQII